MSAPARPAARPGLKRKLARVSLILLALTGVSALLGVGVVELSLAEKQRAALETQIRKTLTTRGLSLTKSHAFVFRSLVADNAVIEMQNTVGRTVDEHDDVIYGVFLSLEGRAWAYCSPVSPCQPGSTAITLHETPEVISALQLPEDAQRQSGSGLREVKLFGHSILEFSEPVMLDDELVGVLRYGLTTKSVEQAVAAARKSQEELVLRELSMFGLGFLGIVAFGVYFARRTAETITRPLSQLTIAAERFARGERDVKVAVASDDEVQVLGDAFNHMVSELELSYSKLETKNRELETEIEQKKRAQDERSELQNHLVQAQKMEAFGQLAGGVAHDFNNILAIIVGNTDLAGFAIEDERLSDEMKRLNAEVRAAAERGANLTRQLLTFARRESDNPRVIDVDETLHAFAKLIRRVLEESVELSIVPGQVSCKVRIDPGRLEQVLMNLCVNARDAMPGGGKISLSTGEETLTASRNVTTGQLEPGRYVWIRAKDTGAGIPREVALRVFEPFFTTKEAGRGTGLGLAMVHSIVHGAGGAIELTSTPGQGSTFTIFLPSVGCVAEEDAPVAAVPVPRSQGTRILLCEDEPAVREVTRRILERGGHAVEESGSGDRALELLRGGRFDLLLTDVVMPHMNGKELADRARLIAPELPVLFVSGYAGGILAAHGIGDESLYFLRKPFQAVELLERVRALVQVRRAP
ncbi:MAG: ATP-binding protein [Myxococcales bacterium]